MKLRLLIVLVLVAVGAGAILYVVRPPSTSGGTSQLLTATASRRTIAQQAVATGNVAFSTVYGVAFGSPPSIVATASGSSSSSASSSSASAGGSGSATWTVSQVKVTAGQTVKKGQVLAVAWAPDLETQLTAANNQLRSANNTLANASDGVNALTSSSTTTAVRAAWNALYAARNAAQSQQGTIANLKKELSYATLKSPADGVVTVVSAVAGLPAPSGVAVQVGADPLEVVGQYAESDVTSLRAGQPATVTISATGATVSGKVVAIAPTAAGSGGSSSVVTYNVTIQLSDPPASVKAGMSANAAITTASAADAIAVPAVALQGGAGDFTVDVMSGDGSLQQVPVQVGLVTSSWAQITSGISEGDVVVTGSTAQRASTTGAQGAGGFGGFGGIGGFGGGTFRGGGGNGRGGNGTGGGGNAQP